MPSFLRPCLLAALLVVAFPLTAAPAASAQAPPRAVRAYAKAGHLFIVDARGNVTQIARARHVVEAALSPDGRRVLYTEGRPTPPDEEAAPDPLWLTDTLGGRARLLVNPGHTRQEPVPREPGLARGKEDVTAEVENNLTGIDLMQFSLNGRTVYFRTFAWQMTSAIHTVDLATGRVRFFCAGNDFTVIRTGKNRGLLRVGQHLYHMKHGEMIGSYDWDFLMTPGGRVLRPLGPPIDPAQE